ncbi:12332_t:CDS:2, partial [Racocetra persica]
VQFSASASAVTSDIKNLIDIYQQASEWLHALRAVVSILAWITETKKLAINKK